MTTVLWNLKEVCCGSVFVILCFFAPYSLILVWHPSVYPSLISLSFLVFLSFSRLSHSVIFFTIFCVPYVCTFVFHPICPFVHHPSHLFLILLSLFIFSQLAQDVRPKWRWKAGSLWNGKVISFWSFSQRALSDFTYNESLIDCF